MPFFCAVPANLPINPERRQHAARRRAVLRLEQGPSTSRSCSSRNPYYGGSRPQRWDTIHVAVGMAEQTSYLQVRNGEVDLDLMTGSRAAAHSRSDQDVRDQQEPVLRRTRRTRSVTSRSTRPAAFFKDPTSAAGGRLRGRPARAAPTSPGSMPAGRTSRSCLPEIPGYRDANIYPARAGRTSRGRRRSSAGGPRRSSCTRRTIAPASTPGRW